MTARLFCAALAVITIGCKPEPERREQAAAEPVRPVEPIDSASQAQVWEQAERDIVQLPLSAFPDLPAAFVRELAGCTVPQTYVTPRTHNVIRGAFASPQQIDFAVLCSRGGESVIRIWWGGPVQCASELQPARDASYLQGIGDGKIGFSRYISTTDSYHDYERESDTAVGAGDGTVKLEHDGIEDAFAEKGSTVWMCRNGKWISFSGAD